jgi:hypothetical protein
MTQALASTDDFRESGWSGSCVVYEHHYDLQRTGDTLTFDDLAFNPIETLAGPATTSSRACSKLRSICSMRTSLGRISCNARPLGPLMSAGSYE